MRLAAGVSGSGLVVFASKKDPRPKPGMCDLRGHWDGSGCWGGSGLRLRGGGPGLGDAGDKPLGQLGGTLEGAAGIGADILEGGEGDHEGEDAPGGISGERW